MLPPSNGSRGLCSTRFRLPRVSGQYGNALDDYFRWCEAAAVGEFTTATSAIELVNSGTQFAQAHLKFFKDNGTPLSLPWTLADATTTAAGLDQTLAPHARVVVASNPADGDPLQVGSA